MKLKFASAVLAAAALVCAVPGAKAQTDYPNKPVKILVGYVPGGGPDMVARALGQKLTEILGQPFVVENRPGAGGSTVTAQVAKMAPDGYNLLLGETGQLVIAPFIFKNLPYDTLKDLTAVALVTTEPLLLVSNAKTPFRKLEDLMREAKVNPGKFNYGSSGVGTIHHISMEAFKADAGLDITHVPYKGSGQSVPGVLAGDVPLLITSFAAAGAHIRSGSLNLLAVTSPGRLPGFPAVPTIGETVKGYDFASEMGVLGPAGMPPAVVAKLAAAIKQASESPDFIAKFKDTATAITYKPPVEYTENLRANLRKFERAVKSAKIAAE
ncbi:MAG: tripartite tricarboxylate transporter substrate binding protein [Bdellovibrionales bacterium]|nr:tripartite tricarboxylate transporter substrate binding protein [Ramlibacter sp.]